MEDHATSVHKANEGALDEILHAILKTLAAENIIPDSAVWATAHGFKHDTTLVGAIKRLEVNYYVTTTLTERKYWGLTPEGEKALAEGSPEAAVFHKVSKEGTDKKDIEKLEAGKIGYDQAMRLKWIRFDKATQKVYRQVDSILDETQEFLGKVKESKEIDQNALATLKKRQLVAQMVSKTFSIKKGPSFSPKWVVPEADLTAEMLASGNWKTLKFKEYNLNALGTRGHGGHLHPHYKVRAQLRNILLEMGFEEMSTNNYVESSFWNFDALFQPQQHPARDAHDTFFLSDPAETLYYPMDFMEKVKEMHTHGGHGSIGWRYNWEETEARKNIMRTHTTAVSARMLHRLAQEGFTPKKYFSIDRVFRNETVDATHLAEFNQVEGVVADYNLTLGHLIGTLKQFYARIGLTELRFKPAYNPYTEPSMEIFGYHPERKKWMEMGNTGVFRPELLLPMGIPEGVSVIAWGLGLERLIMVLLGLKKIRDLVGHEVDLEFIRSNPICRFNE